MWWKLLATMLTLAGGHNAGGTGAAVSGWSAGSGDDGQRDVEVRIWSAPLGSGAVVWVHDDEDEDCRDELPDVWIGVRVTNVPPALKAHLNCEGLMVANVVVDSPADRAGLERYDVIVRFAGRDIRSMNDLREAIEQTGADKEVEVVVLHAGQQTTLRITPARRDASAELRFKYHEPGEDADEYLEKYFGHWLKLGPDGDLQLIPQGRLDNLPDDLKNLLEDLESEEGFDFLDDLELPWQMLFDPNADDDMFRFFNDENDIEGQIEIRIEDGGKSISLKRRTDGTIEVQRRSADDQTSSATYSSAKELEENDPEAYKLYRRFIQRGRALVFTLPDLSQLREQQRRFQEELEKKLDHFRELRRKLMRHHRGIHQQRVRKDTGPAPGTTREITVTIKDDGRIAVRVVEDGVVRRYEFDSREDFRRLEPELYDELESEIEQD